MPELEHAWATMAGCRPMPRRACGVSCRKPTCGKPPRRRGGCIFCLPCAALHCAVLCCPLTQPSQLITRRPLLPSADQYLYSLYWAVTTLSMVEANSVPASMPEIIRQAMGQHLMLWPIAVDSGISAGLKVCSAAAVRRRACNCFLPQQRTLQAQCAAEPRRTI